MVEFMEANGDLSKTASGTDGRIFSHVKWRELKVKLNRDATGAVKSEEKWRKVWSDLKNNCKRKFAKIQRATNDNTSVLKGGPANRLSDIEKRVMQIIEKQATIGIRTVKEVGFQQDEVSEAVKPEESACQDPLEIDKIGTYIIDWSTPTTSSQPVEVPSSPPPSSEHLSSPPASSEDEESKSPPRKRAKKELSNMFLEADRQTREYARERDKVYDELEKERLRLRNKELRVRELEIKERVRQRDEELRLQGQWLDFFKESMEVVVSYLERHSHV